MSGGLIGVVPDSKLLAYKAPEALTQRSQEVLKILAFPDVKNKIESVVTVQGSYNFPIYPYYSDIDSINRVKINFDHRLALNIFIYHIQKVAKYLKTNKRGWMFSDLKCGLDGNNKGIHWKLDEILKGRTHSGKSLINSLTENGYCKYDVIVPYYGRYIEISLIYSVFSNDGLIGQVPLSLNDFIIQITKSYYELMSEGNYYKAIKRLYSLSRLTKDVKTIRAISQLLTSNLGKLSQIKADLSTIKLIIDNGNYPTLNYINIEFNKIKEGLATILDVPINYKVSYKIIDNVYSLLTHHKKEESLIELDRIIEVIYKQLNKETMKYLRHYNLTFSPRK